MHKKKGQRLRGHQRDTVDRVGIGWWAWEGGLVYLAQDF